MKPLFSKLGMQLIESFAIADPLYAFDFDGTLAPIVRLPEDARMSKSVQVALKSLSACSDVAVISGRSLADLKERIPILGLALVGNHGLEGLSLKNSSLEEARNTSKKWQSAIKRALGDKAESRGVMVENKTYSIAVHYRLSRNKKIERARIMEIVATLNPVPKIIFGKCVVNLIPSSGPHKGMALLELMKNKGKKCAIYIGDDDTDEDVFSLSESGLLLVRIGRKKLSSASFYLSRQSEIRKFIELSVKARVSR